jgi:hypothetical protein
MYTHERPIFEAVLRAGGQSSCIREGSAETARVSSSSPFACFQEWPVPELRTAQAAPEALDPRLQEKGDSNAAAYSQGAASIEAFMQRSATPRENFLKPFDEKEATGYDVAPKACVDLFSGMRPSIVVEQHYTMPLLKENAKQHMCSDCANRKTREEYSASMWKNRVQAWRATLCAHCEAAHTLRRASAVALCQVCGKHKSAVSFFSKAWKHRGTRSSMQCIDCEHPACTAPQCQQCRLCRQHHRKDKKCESGVQPLHSRVPRPTTFTEVQRFVCCVCRPILCDKWPECSEVRKRKEKKKRKQYRCGNCEEAGHTLRRASAVSRCRVCGKHKSAASFFLEDWKKHKGSHSRMECMDCDHKASARGAKCKQCREDHKECRAGRTRRRHKQKEWHFRARANHKSLGACARGTRKDTGRR